MTTKLIQLPAILFSSKALAKKMTEKWGSRVDANFWNTVAFICDFLNCAARKHFL